MRSFSVQFERFGELGERVSNFDGLLRFHAYQRDHEDGTDGIEREHLTTTMSCKGEETGRVTQFGMRASMSRKGNCYDNAPMESFWGTLKNELVHHRRYATRAEAQASIQEYIEIFYNRQRRHSRIGFVPPALFAEEFSKQLQAA